jgi:hypothetical protein
MSLENAQFNNCPEKKKIPLFSIADPGCLSRIPDPGVKKAPNPDPDPQHCHFF